MNRIVHLELCRVSTAKPGKISVSVRRNAFIAGFSSEPWPHEYLCLWFFADPEEPFETRTFELCAPMDDVPPTSHYIGSTVDGSKHRWFLFEHDPPKIK